MNLRPLNDNLLIAPIQRESTVAVIGDVPHAGRVIRAGRSAKIPEGPIVYFSRYAGKAVEDRTLLPQAAVLAYE